MDLDDPFGQCQPDTGAFTGGVEAFEKARNEVRSVIMDLSSPGGSLYEGREVIRVIDRMKRTHKVATHVGRKQICLSMCVPIFLQGQERVAAATGDGTRARAGAEGHNPAFGEAGSTGRHRGRR